MSEKPRLLVLYGQRDRSNMAVSTYWYMKRNQDELPFETHIAQDVPGGTNLKRWCDRFLDEYPTHIIGGLGCDYGSFSTPENWDFIEKNEIKTVFQIGDLTQFIESPPAVVMNAVSPWDALWVVSTGCQEVEANSRIHEHVKMHDMLSDTKVIYHPWSFDPDMWFDANMPRDTDVFFSMTIDGNWFSRDRARMYNGLNPLRKKCKVWSGLIEKNNWIGIHGKPYREGLWRSKICMVDTAMRNNMTAKYLEAGASGCLLMGDAPWGMEDVFNDDTMCILDYNNMEFDLEKQIDYYLKNPGEVLNKTNAMKKNMDQFTHKVSVPELERKLLEV